MYKGVRSLYSSNLLSYRMVANLQKKSHCIIHNAQPVLKVTKPDLENE